jgi:hypothetical protein
MSLDSNMGISARANWRRTVARRSIWYYHVRDFIFLAPTGVIDEESAPPVEE